MEAQSLVPDSESSEQKLSQDDSCDFNPDFAVICSFIDLFGEKIEVNLNIEQLKSSIEDQEYLDENLVDLHVKLLRKIRRYLVRDQWEKVLIGFVSEYSFEDAYELEQLGYLKTRPSLKLQLLRRLLDAQFEYDPKFKAAVNLCEANDLRLMPAGRDIKGNSYWQRSDSEGNVRIFLEEPLNHKSWKTICRDNSDLKQLIEDLEKIKDDKIKGEPQSEPYHPLPEIFPELFNQEKVEDDASTIKKTINGRGGKKGRSRGRAKKPALLTALKEEAEEENTHDNEQDAIKLSPKTEHSKSGSSNDSHSTESSYVSQVLESVVSRVSSLLSPFSNFKNEPNVENFNGITPVESTEIVINTTEFLQNNGNEKVKFRKRPAKREKPKIEELPRRSSSRIQHLQQKKEEEMKKMIESKTNDNLADIEQNNNNARECFSKRRSSSPEDKTKKNGKCRKDRQRWRQGKGKKKLSWDKDDSDLSSTSSLTVSNDEGDEVDDELKFENNDDDEFACEEEDTNCEPVIIKRARTARQIVESDNEGELNESSIVEEDKPCGRCDKSHDPEKILLCDMCDDGYHTDCCIPPLMIVPDGDWYCPSCEHKMLLIKLVELHASVNEILEAKERERLKRQRLRQNNVKRDVAKASKPENEVIEKRRRDILDELNDPIAIQDLDEDLEALPSSHRERAYHKPNKRTSKARRKNHRRRRRREFDDDEEDDEIAFTIGSRKQRKSYSRRHNYSDIEDDTDDEVSSIKTSSSESSADVQLPRTRKAKACVSYRFQEYDELIKSAIQVESDHADESEDADDESASEQCNYGRGKDMATIEALAYQQENGLVESGNALQNSSPPVTPKPKSRGRKKGMRLNDLDADSEVDGPTSDESFQASATEVEEEDEDDENLTELDSDEDDDTSIDEIISSRRSRANKKSKSKKRRRSTYESDESDFEPTRTRRAAAKRVSYNESTDDDEEDFLHEPRKVSKTILSSDAESEASWRGSTKSDADEDIDGIDEPEVDESTSCVETDDELLNNSKISKPKEKDESVVIPVESEVLQPSEHDKQTSSRPTSSKSNTILDELPPGPKRIRLEKRETRPVFNPDLVKNEPTVKVATTAPLSQETNSPQNIRTAKNKSSPKLVQTQVVPHNVPIVRTQSQLTTAPTQSESSPSLAPRLPLAQAPQLSPIPQRHSIYSHPPPHIQQQPPPPMYHLPVPQPMPPSMPLQYNHQPSMPDHHRMQYHPPPYGLPYGPMAHSPYHPVGMSTHIPPPPQPVNSYIPHQGPPAPYMMPQPVLTELGPNPHRQSIPLRQPPVAQSSTTELRPALQVPTTSAATSIMPMHINRDPIHELNQYCTGSTYPSNIFSSFNISLPPKNVSPSLPSFYDDDEVRPKPNQSAETQKTNLTR